MDLVSYDVLRMSVLVSAAALLLALEQRMPFAFMQRPWRVNLGLWLVDSVLMRVVCGACGLVVAFWVEQQQVGLMQWFSVHWLVQVLLGVILLDSVLFLWHRANHQFAFLWRWHLVHHADKAFQVTTALRFHPGELLLALPVRIAAIALFGIPVLALVVFELCFGVMNLLVHSNIAFSRRTERWLSKLFITPSLHRSHHRRDMMCMDRNFGTIFSWFDRMCSTLLVADERERFETGIPGEVGDKPMSLRDAMTAPWVIR